MLTLTASGQDVNKQFITNTTWDAIYASFMVNVAASAQTGIISIHLGLSNTTFTFIWARVFVKDASMEI